MTKTIAFVTVALLALGGGAAYYFMYMTAPDAGQEDVMEAKTSEKSDPGGEEVSGSTGAEEKDQQEGEDGEAKDSQTKEVDRSKIKMSASDWKAKAADKALKNLEKEREDTVEFLNQYDRETIRKKERAEAVTRWLNKN